jgi:hypothetical protein
VGDALQRRGVERAVRAWLLSRPVTNVHFHNDLSVRISLSAPPEELARTIQSAVTKEKDFPQPTAAQWQRVREAVAGRVGPAVGVGHVMAGPAAPRMATTQAADLIPDQPPEWVGRQIEADGVIKAEGSRLKGARAAEQRAIQQIARQVDELPLAEHVKIGEAARSNGDVEQAIERALGQAHTDRAQYGEDGSVTVRMSLDLREVWQELDALRP